MYKRNDAVCGYRSEREEGGMGAVLGQTGGITMQPELTTSKAISILSVHAQNAIGAAGAATIGNDRTYEEYLALEMGIQALQKQLVDRIPCEWCDVYAHSTARKYNYCPDCGRRLPEANRGQN